MSISLDPIVAARMRQFRRRRTWLILLRGLSAGIVSFLICMAIVASIDWYWLLTDDARWLLSGSAYTVIAGIVWWTSLKQLGRVPQEELASQVEALAPELRENLRSAVELVVDDPATVHDSLMFRSLLQGQVAEQMAHIRVGTLLPWKRVAKWVMAAVVVGALAAWLLTAGDPRLRQLATRAILPGANIARVSRIHVEILKPTPHSLLLAEDETVAVLVEISGGKVSEVTLETASGDAETVQLAMRSDDDRQYVANIRVGEHPIDYRILAGDAVTQRYRIESRPRPHVKIFKKSFTYPDYTLLPPHTVAEPDGDLEALEGTVTELVITTDQPVSQAELLIDDAQTEEVRKVALESLGENRWRTEFPLQERGVYKVHLVSQETGFENIFAPKYEITPLPDLVPRAGFVDQQEATLLLPPNDILSLKGMAEDDLPLEQLEQHISINGRDWLAVPLQTIPFENNERQLTADWQWDLLHHKLKVGDQVLTKLVAKDRKGNIGESIPLRIVVSAPEFDPERHQTMEVKAGLVLDVQAFADRMQEHRETALAILERMQSNERQPAELEQDRISLADIQRKQRDDATELLQKVQAVLPKMPASGDAYDLDLIGRLLGKIQEQTSAADFLLTARELAADDKQRQREDNDLKNIINRLADDAKRLAEHYRTFVTQTVAHAGAVDLKALWHQQQLVMQSAEGEAEQSWDRLLRQVTVTINQLLAHEKVMRQQRAHVTDHAANQLRSHLDWCRQQRERLEFSSESREQFAELKRNCENVMREFEHRQNFGQQFGSISNNVVNGRKDLENRAGSLYEPLDRLSNSMREWNDVATKASEATDSNAVTELAPKLERAVAELDERWRPALQQFLIRRGLTQLRQDTNSQLAADLGLTHRATVSLLNRHRLEAPQDLQIVENVKEVAPAYRILEAGHIAIGLEAVISGLLHDERWELQTAQARWDHPAEWDVLTQGFELASQRFREARLPNELLSQLDQLRWSEPVREASKKLTERRWRPDFLVSSTSDLNEIQEQLRDLLEELDPYMVEARAIIAQYAPTIPEMAREAAAELRELETETTEAADALEMQPVEPPSLRPLQAEQELIHQQIDDLQLALVEEANTQDIMDAEQRERARDADDSIALLEEAEAAAQQALEEALKNEDPVQQAEELAEAAEQQERTAQALEMVAEHFERLEQGQDVAESRAALRQFEREMGIARQLDQQFQQAEEVARQADQSEQSPQEMLAELEAELQRNPAMQQALSEISQQTLAEAQSALEFSAEEDHTLQRDLERADENFQQQKRDLAEDLRELSHDVNRLSRELVSQADQAARRGRTDPAHEKLAAAQQALNEAAAKAGNAQEHHLLKELQSTVAETNAALEQATKALEEAKQATAQGENEEIHKDEKTRESQQRDAEKTRKQWHDQEKRSQQQEIRRAEDLKRRADQEVRNAENQVRTAERNLQQAQDRLNKQPEDQNLQRARNDAQARKDREEQTLQNRKQTQKAAEQNIAEQKQELQAIEKLPMPALDKANPFTQLADDLTQRVMEKAAELQQTGKQLQEQADFSDELTPPQHQLAHAAREQADIQQDVERTSENVARAARHERRLQNEAAVEPLMQAAESIQQTADEEVQQSQSQLTQAEQAAEDATTADSSNHNNSTPPRDNQPALQAQESLATAEAALLQEAEQLQSLAERMSAAETDAAAQALAQTDPGEQNAGGEQTAEGDPQAANSQTGETQGTPTASAKPAFTPEEQARGEQLARMLDELDRQQNQAGDAIAADASAQLEALAQAARNQQTQMSRNRAQQQATFPQGYNIDGVPPETGGPVEFDVLAVNREENENWGQLRSKSAEDLTQGRSATVSEEYRQSVEAYFRVLAERARRKK